MKWKIKALIQKFIASFPEGINDSAYYYMQRKIGALRTFTPIPDLKLGFEMCSKILSYNGKNNFSDAVVFEIGTGRRINTPLVFWLFGAKKIITVDVNNYLRMELIRKDIEYIKSNQDEVTHILNGIYFDDDRFNYILKVDSSKLTLDDFCIEYHPHCDASKTSFKDSMFDYHVSSSVFEHIPPVALSPILKEAKRITKEDGLILHRIDFSDHFSHDDSAISPINFLKFSEKKWNKIAGNKYMYMNRLRFDDFESLYKNAGHAVLKNDICYDENIKAALLNSNFKLDEAFKNKSIEALSARNAWFYSN